MTKPQYWLASLESEQLTSMLSVCEQRMSEGVSVTSFSDLGSTVNFLREWNAMEMAEWLSEELVRRGIRPIYTYPVKQAGIVYGC